MNKTRVRLAALLLAVSFALSGCSLVKNIGGSSGAGTKTITRPAVESAELQFTHPAAGEPVAVFDTTAGVFRAVLFPEQAPQAYDNFVGLVQAGYYNGLTVTRVEQDFVVEAGQGADGKGTTIWNGSRYPAEATDKLHHYSGALCMAADSSGQCASVFYIMSTLPGGDSVTQELTDQMNSAGYRAEVVSAYQTAGGAPYLDYTDTVLGQVYEGMDVVDTIAQAAVDENQKPTETITINSVSIETTENDKTGFPVAAGKPVLCCSGSNFAGVLLAPGEVILQNDRGADGIQNGLAVGTKSPHLVQDIGGFTGGLPLVPHPHGQAAPDLNGLGQLAALAGALALGAVHVQRQADDDELGFDLLCHLADPGGNFVPGLDGDLGRDGRSQELGAVAGGAPRAAGTVINC